MKRIALSLILLLFGALPALASPNAALSQLLKDYDEAQLVMYPSAALSRGDLRYLDKYEDNLTAGALATLRRENADFQSRLKSIDRASLDGQDQLSYDIFSWQLNDDAGGLAPGIGERFQMLPIDQFNGPHIAFAIEMSWRSRFPFTSVEQYEKAISRMKGFAHWIDTAIDRMRDGEKIGVTQPRIIVERLIGQAEEQANKKLEDSVFYGPVANMPPGISGPERIRIGKDYSDTVRDVVLPAYGRLAQFLRKEYLPKARKSVGLSAMPGGHAMYLYLVRHHTTTERTPEAIHKIGLEEVARITAEMEALKRQIGYKRSLADFRAYLRTSPRFKFKTRDEMMAAYQSVKAKVASNLPRLFDTLPKVGFDIRFFPDFVATTQTSAQYNNASADGTRPGIFYINGYDLPERPTYQTEVLSLHESMPGHHLQLELQQENQQLPDFRRFGGVTAFVEGWGLYSERLGPDLGLYTDPYQKFAMLSFDMWRACRLVVDTGIHNGTMTREQAIKYMLNNTSLSARDVVAEVERYIAYPGQALAYKSGQLDLLRLRNEARKRLGDRFDIRRFHDAILLDGAMPLSILDEKMERWLAAQ